MLNLSKPDIQNINFKLKKSLKYNLKRIAHNKSTKHLIEVTTFEKGEVFIKERDSVKGVYFILKGKAKVFNTNSGSSIPVIFRLVQKGELVGFSSFNSLNYLSSVEAVNKIEAYFINRKNFKFLLKRNNKLNVLFLNALILKLQNFEMRQRFLPLFNSTNRIIEALLLIASKFGYTTENGIEVFECTSRKEIAALANTSYENTVRVLSRLKNNGLIEVHGKLIILNKQLLIDKLKESFNTADLEFDLIHTYLD